MDVLLQILEIVPTLVVPTSRIMKHTLCLE